MNSRYFKFWWISIYYFFSCTFCVFKKSLIIPRSWRYSHMLSSEVLITLAFIEIHRSVIHQNKICLHGWCRGWGSTFFHLNIQLFLLCFLKENSFFSKWPQWPCWKFIDHICLDLFLNFLFCSTDLGVYLYTNTRLP